MNFCGYKRTVHQFHPDELARGCLVVLRKKVDTKPSPSLRHKSQEIAQERKSRRKPNIQMSLNSAYVGGQEVPAEEKENVVGGGEKGSFELCFIGHRPASCLLP